MRNKHSIGEWVQKDGPADDQIKNDGIEAIGAELSEAVGIFKDAKTDFDTKAKELKELRDAVESRKELDGEIKTKIEKAAEGLSDALTRLQASEQAVDLMKKQLDQPIYGTKGDLAEKDRETAVEIQRMNHMQRDGGLHDFRPDMDNLVNLADARSAMMKMMSVGEVSREAVIRSFTEAERKAFDAASMDQAMFPAQMLGIEIDCNTECAYLLDLYDQVRVNRSSFMYPKVKSYGDIGTYDCDAKCDAEYGPEGNITYAQGTTYDFRGAFCFNRDVLREANYDLLGFMVRAASRSHRINRNRALMVGDGLIEPQGWLTAACFKQRTTATENPSHVDLRQFLASVPMEYGMPLAVMHQNTFTYFASMVDANGRFLFGDGDMCYDPNQVRDKVRISNCLPDPTEGGTKGSDTNPFDAGGFIAAAGVWETAYKSVEQRPMSMEQFVGGSGKWCVQYQFGAKDGGFVGCCEAAQTLHAGAAPAEEEKVA